MLAGGLLADLLLGGLAGLEWGDMSCDDRDKSTKGSNPWTCLKASSSARKPLLTALSFLFLVMRISILWMLMQSCAQKGTNMLLVAAEEIQLKPAPDWHFQLHHALCHPHLLCYVPVMPRVAVSGKHHSSRSVANSLLPNDRTNAHQVGNYKRTEKW